MRFIVKVHIRTAVRATVIKNFTKVCIGQRFRCCSTRAARVTCACTRFPARVYTRTCVLRISCWMDACRDTRIPCDGIDGFAVRASVQTPCTYARVQTQFREFAYVRRRARVYVILLPGFPRMMIIYYDYNLI